VKERLCFYLSSSRLLKESSILNIEKRIRVIVKPEMAPVAKIVTSKDFRPNKVTTIPKLIAISPKI